MSAIPQGTLNGIEHKQQTQQCIEDKALACVDLANRYFNISMSYPVVKLNQRGKAAGTAYLMRNEVRFNYHMYCQNPQLFVDRVVPHEIAHLIVYHLYGNTVRPHGKQWQNVMQDVFGVPAERTHNFTPAPPKNVFTYQCACQTHELSIRRHKRILQGGQYVCKLCKSALVIIN